MALLCFLADQDAGKLCTLAPSWRHCYDFPPWWTVIPLNGSLTKSLFHQAAFFLSGFWPQGQQKELMHVLTHLNRWFKHTSDPKVLQTQRWVPTAPACRGSRVPICLRKFKTGLVRWLSCHQAWSPVFGPQDPHGRRKRVSPTGCALTPRYIHIMAHAHKINKV